MDLKMGGWSLRLAALAVAGVGVFALAPGCGGDSGSSGNGGVGAKDGGIGGIGNTGGGGVGNTGGGGVGNTGGGGVGNTGGGGVGGEGGCPAGLDLCDGACVDTQNNPKYCGSCTNACQSGQFCSQGTCNDKCLGGTIDCGGKCVDTQSDENNCGACGTKCDQGKGESCSLGVCGVACVGGTTKCGTDCVDIQSSPLHCGGCGQACTTGQVCAAGQCTAQCPSNLTKCGNSCVDTKNDKNNCGNCGNTCPSGQACLNGTCGTCDTQTTDCDGDGFAGSNEGDCCEVPGVCGANPNLVNPGAFEVVGNGIDDNCNGLTDYFDKSDTVKCDTGLASDSSDPKDYAKALGICRSTEENPASKKDKTWGLISAEILRADGSPLGDAKARSIREKFGSSITALEGNSMVVISSGIASDATQTNPGPNGGAPTGSNVSNSHSPGGGVNLQTCTNPSCIKDWFTAANPPLKKANEWPVAANCGSGTNGVPTANDSVMLKLRLRAPTNARAFSFNSYFFSAEYPEWVCTNFNDIYLALVDTPSGTPSPIPNPVDKNLMTYTDLSTNPPSKWPIGINIAKGTNLFAVCDATGLGTSTCQLNNINTKSCSLGPAELTGTGFEKSGSCLIGGGTYWLTTAGNVIPGQIVELRLVIFDVGDTAYDSLALIDGFGWLTNATLPGTG